MPRLGGAALIATLALAAAAGTRSETASGAPGSGERPNVVVIMSDDQTLDSLRYMQRVNALIADKGVSFPESVTNWPLCCPSRATFLTGQYAHNHQVLGNSPPSGGFDRLDGSETLPVWLQRAGYYTAHIGKFLNGYEDSAVGVPPGWSEWHGSKQTYTFYGYALLENGQLIEYGSNDEDPDVPAQPETYSTDVYTDKAVELISRRAPANQPFFLSLAYLAPHSGGPNPDPNTSRCAGTAKPAERHVGRFANEPLPQGPAFNEADVADKPAGIAGREALTPEQVANAERRYRCRAESLLAIDDGVERVMAALRQAGELDDTLVVYTSDNGFFHGEHRIATGKNRVYEEAIRVPLLIRGPGIPAGKTVDDLAINADLAPTILDAAGADAGRAQDGRSLLASAAHPERKRGRELLIEQYTSAADEEGIPGVVYQAVRNARYTYVENGTGEVELYDLENDPFQLSNQHANPAYGDAEARLAARLDALRACAGPSCRARPTLKLKLPRSRVERGRSCRRASGFIARVRGADTDGVERVTFRVGAKRAGRDSGARLKQRLKPRLLRGKRRPELRAIVEMVDGRELSLQKRARICR